MGFVLVGLTSGKMDNIWIAKASKNKKKRANTYLVMEKKLLFYCPTWKKNIILFICQFSVNLVTEWYFKDLNEGC